MAAAGCRSERASASVEHAGLVALIALLLLAAVSAGAARPLGPAAGPGRLPLLPARELRGSPARCRRHSPDPLGQAHHGLYRDRRSAPLRRIRRDRLLALPPYARPPDKVIPPA